METKSVREKSIFVGGIMDKELHDFVFGGFKETVDFKDVFGDSARITDPILQEDMEAEDKAELIEENDGLEDD
jgi:hypothetical protein